MSDQPVCASCAAFLQHEVFDSVIRAMVNKPQGDCRLRAPIARLDRDGKSGAAAWPVVRKTDFCGDWRERPES